MAKTPESWEMASHAFHLHVGYCIAQWASVDDQLFTIFRQCVGPHKQSAIIYYRTPGLEMRFSLTNELVQSLLPDKTDQPGGHDHSDTSAWRKAKSGYERLLGERRRIAHHPIDATIDFPDRPGLINSTPFDASAYEPRANFQIYASHHERLRRKEANTPPLKLPDLGKHLREVRALSDRLRTFFQETMKSYAPTFPSLTPQLKTLEHPEADAPPEK